MTDDTPKKKAVNEVIEQWRLVCEDLHTCDPTIVRLVLEHLSGWLEPLGHKVVPGIDPLVVVMPPRGGASRDEYNRQVKAASEWIKKVSPLGVVAHHGTRVFRTNGRELSSEPVPCKQCKGTGTFDFGYYSGSGPCQFCDATGVAKPDSERPVRHCSLCDSQGVIDDRPCPACGITQSIGNITDPG